MINNWRKGKEMLLGSLSKWRMSTTNTKRRNKRNSGAISLKSMVQNTQRTIKSKKSSDKSKWQGKRRRKQK
jgi:hypothetical protein